MISDEQRKFLDYWEKNLAKGRAKYALLDGLKWSLSVTIFVLLFQYYILKAAQKPDFLLSIVIEIPVILIAGFVIYYYFMWNLYSKKYQQIKDQKEQK